MKIGYLTHDMDPHAGWGRLASDIISGVKKTAQEIIVLKEIDDKFEGIPILRRGNKLFLSAFYARKYLKNCDVVHAFDIYPNGIIAVLATIFLKKKVVITLVGTYSVAPLYNIKTSLLAKFALFLSAHVTSISEYTKNEVCKKMRLRAVSVITPGIDLNVFQKEHIDSCEPFIISVGALKERKGYHNAIPAFALLREKFPTLKYKIVGSQSDAHYYARLKSIVHELGLGDTVEFLSNLSDTELSMLYKEAKLFLLPSINAEGNHFEGFGIVFLEAAAAGLPVVGTAGNGIEDAIHEGVNGFLVPQNDIQSIANAIVKILDTDCQREKMSTQSYSWAKSHSLDDMIKKYLKVYDEVK